MKFYIQLILILIFCLPLKGLGQDIFDAPHSYQYTTHLICAGEFSMAIHDLKAADLKFPSDTFTSMLLYCYHSINDLHAAFELLNSKQPNFNSQWIKEEIAGFCIAHDSIAWLLKSPIFNSLPSQIKATAFLLNGNDSMASGEITRIGNLRQREDLNTWLIHKQEIPKPKPFRYALASALIPGSGKFFIGEWKDGFNGLTTTAVYSFLAFTSFQHFGIRSVFGWINSGFALVFYGGTIAGTATACNRIYAYKLKLLKNELSDSAYNPNCRFNCN